MKKNTRNLRGKLELTADHMNVYFCLRVCARVHRKRKTCLFRFWATELTQVLLKPGSFAEVTCFYCCV